MRTLISGERLLPHLLLLAAERVGAGVVLHRERLAVGQRAQAVGALLVAEAVEQRVGARRVEPHARAVLRIVADDAGRNRELRFDRLAVAHDADLLVDVVRHGHRAAQRDLLLGQAADHRVLHVPEHVADLGVDEARQLDALAAELRVELVAVEHLRRERTFHVHEVELAFLEREEARLVLLHDADLDAPDLGHLLALHLGDELRVLGIVGLEVPREAAVLRVRLEDDLVAADPLLQARTGRCRRGWTSRGRSRRDRPRSPRGRPRDVGSCARMYDRF